MRPARPHTGFLSDVRHNRFIYLLMLPGMAFLFVFSFLPLAGWLLAFKDYKLANGVLGSPFVGLKHFRFFFATKDWLPVTVNTVRLNAFFIFFGMGAAILLALILNEINSQAVKRLVQSGVFLPYFISWVVVQQMVYAFLGSEQGLLTRLLQQVFGLRVNFYASPHLWRCILTVIHVLKMSGYYAVIFIGAITAIDPEYYESAVIDGASRLQLAAHITLPLIRKAIMVMLLLAIGRIFYGDVGMIYGLVGDNSLLYSTTDVIDTYAYRALRRMNNFSMASAVTIYQSLMGIVTVLFFNGIVRKFDDSAKLF
jgi:putative aldouronate transport system permease protein